MSRALRAVIALLVLGGCGIYGPPERPSAAKPESPQGAPTQPEQGDDEEQPQ